MVDLPQAFGRYVLTRLIGEGGMAEVYLATVQVAEGLTKRVVIKKIRKELVDHHEFTRMFVDEAKIALSLNHANIVQVFDFGQVHGTFYLAMEIVEGIDLMRLFHAVRNRGQSFPAVIAAYLGHQVAAGLAYAHRKTDEHGRPLGIVHRDVSPHNIMVSHEGQVKILDFGIARMGAVRVGVDHGGTDRNGRVSSAGKTRTHGESEETIKGKVAYMSPEQAQGKSVDHRSDIYSLGVVLYELLTGRLLFRTKDRHAALRMVRTQPIAPIEEVLPDLPPELARIVNRALERDPADRYGTVRAMQGDLAAYLHRADPVVDDEVLSRFVASYHAPPDPLTEVSTLEPPTRDVAASHGTSYPRGTTRAAERVVVVHAALDTQPPREGQSEAQPPVDPQAFLHLIQDIAFKREARVLRLDERAVILAFGTLLRTGDDADRAVRVALALREDVGETAPGLKLGIVVARVGAIVHRSATGNISVELRHGVEEQLDQIARASMETHVMVGSDLVEPLSRAWRFGEGRFVDMARHLTATAVDHELEHITPLLGPALQSERRVHQVPGGRTLLFGRELELKTLRDTFSEAIRMRQSRSVLVLGVPGIGKRALVERFVGSLPRTACWILRGSGTYPRRNLALGVFLDLLTRFLEVDHTSTHEQVVAALTQHGVRDAAPLGEALASALGLETPTGHELDPFTRRDRLWKLVRRLISGLAQRRPVLIVLENIHYHDEQSILLLREWAQVRHAWPILGVVTGQPGNRRVEMIRHDPNIVTIELGELDAQARRELIVRRFEDPERAQDLADCILSRTGGNPLFIEQVLASLIDKGVVGWNAQGRYLTVARKVLQIDVPPSVEAALAERVEDLSKDDREVLQAAAVLGRQFRPPELGHLLQKDVSQSLAVLLDRNFLERVVEPAHQAERELVRFATMTLHEVCKGSLSPTLAHKLHGRVADIIAARSDYTPERDDGVLAEHLLAADRPGEAVEPALRAAMRAYDLAGNLEAYYHLSQALRAMPPGSARRWDALLRRERILRAWGRRRAQGGDVRQLLELATQSGDDTKIAIASIRLLRFYLEVGRHAQAERLIPRLEQRINAIPNPQAFLAVLGELKSELHFARGEFRAAEETARRALVHCGPDQRGARQRCRLLRSIGQVKNSIGDSEEASRVYEEALDIARGISNQRLEANLLNALGEAAGRGTHYQRALEHFRAALAIDRDLGDRYATGRKLANLGMTYACVGAHRRAERCLRKALELHEAVGESSELTDVVIQLGEVMAAVGDFESAKQLLVDAAEVAHARGDVRHELRARVRWAGVLAQSPASPADLARAEEMSLSVLETARLRGLRTSACRALHVLARLAAQRGDTDAAIAHEREAVELVRQGAAPLDGVLAVHHLGCLLVARGDDAEGRALLAEAAATIRQRVEALEDPALRRAYLEQTDARQILADAGIPADLA